jgi:hypothetical protein
MPLLAANTSLLTLLLRDFQPRRALAAKSPDTMLLYVGREQGKIPDAARLFYATEQNKFYPYVNSFSELFHLYQPLFKY